MGYSNGQLRPSNWDRPRFDQGDWGKSRFDMSFQDGGENNRRQNPFGIFGPFQRTTEPPPIVGEIPGQIGRNRGFGQRGKSGNDKQPRPPSLPPMPQNPKQPGQGPGVESEIGKTDSTEIPMSTQSPLGDGLAPVGPKGKIMPGQRGKPGKTETTPAPQQQPTTQFLGESEENFGGFRDGEFSPLPPPPVTRNPNQAEQRRTGVPGQMWGTGQSGTPPSPRPGMGQEPGQMADEEFGSSGERGFSNQWQPPVEQHRGQAGYGRGIGQRKSTRPIPPGGSEQDYPSVQEDDEMESGEELNRELGGSKQRQTPIPPQDAVGQGRNPIGQRRRIGSGPQQPPVYHDQGQPGYGQETGRRPGRFGRPENHIPLNEEDDEMEVSKQRQIPTPPQPATDQDQNHIGRRRGSGRGFRQYDSGPPTVGRNPIHPGNPRQSVEPESQIGGPRYNGVPGVTQPSDNQVPRQLGPRRGTRRNGSRGRNIPGSEQYPTKQDPNEVGDAEVITSPTYFIRNRGDSDGTEPSTPPRPNKNHRPSQGSGEQGDLEGVETKTKNGSRPPRG